MSRTYRKKGYRTVARKNRLSGHDDHDDTKMSDRNIQRLPKTNYRDDGFTVKRDWLDEYAGHSSGKRQRITAKNIIRKELENMS